MGYVIVIYIIVLGLIYLLLYHQQEVRLSRTALALKLGSHKIQPIYTKPKYISWKSLNLF